MPTTRNNGSTSGWAPGPLPLKLYNRAIFGLPESDRYDLTRYKWTNFYQELEDAISTFGFKAEVLIAKERDVHQSPTKVECIDRVKDSQRKKSSE